MTDKLTPPMLRDLARLHESAPLEIRFGDFLREEAARREAEQPCSTPGECEVGGCLKPSACQAAAVEDKPAPAADDPDGLIAGLRAMGLTTASIAADRIEQQAREIARLREALERAAKRFRWYEEIHASKTPPDDDKAKRNREFAEDCEAALARGGDNG